VCELSPFKDNLITSHVSICDFFIFYFFWKNIYFVMCKSLYNTWHWHVASNVTTKRIVL